MFRQRAQVIHIQHTSKKNRLREDTIFTALTNKNKIIRNQNVNLNYFI